MSTPLTEAKHVTVPPRSGVLDFASHLKLETLMNQDDVRTYRYRFTGHERVLHNVRAQEALPDLLELFGYERVFIVCSKTLNTKTPRCARSHLRSEADSLDRPMRSASIRRYPM